MAGGGGRKAANYIYNSAKPDGLTLANPGFAMVSSAILGDSGILYDLNKLHYMGSPYSQYHGLFVTRKEAALNSIEKLRAALGIRVGAQSVGFINYNEGRLFAYILGLNEPKFIASYSGPELDAALLLVIMSRAFRLSGTPNVAPPNMPKDRIAILQEAFRKTFKDPDFARDYKKLTGEDATPLMPEDTERAIQNIPRDQEVVQVFNKLIGAGPLPGK